MKGSKQRRRELDLQEKASDVHEMMSVLAPLKKNQKLNKKQNFFVNQHKWEKIKHIFSSSPPSLPIKQIKAREL